MNGSYEKADAVHASHIAVSILSHLRDDAPLTARRVLESEDAAEYLDPDDMSALRVRVAAGLLSHGQNRESLLLAEQSLQDNAKAGPETLWIAALAAYGSGQYDKSLRYLTIVEARANEPWAQSAAAFWIARSAQRLGDHDSAKRWLATAAAEKGTFYGMLAARVLDDNSPVATSALSIGESVSFPGLRWKPHDGFAVDPSLICAIVRQESKFDPEAESGAGAIGLMQIMPDTAVQVTQRKDNWEEALFDPQTNLDIGQNYVRFLLNSSNISQNMILMAVAYNGGPTALAHWRRDNLEQQDPLLFVETWPVGETRGFIEQVMANYWTYRARMGEDTASLTDLAHGRWPLYVGPPAVGTVVADAR